MSAAELGPVRRADGGWVRALAPAKINPWLEVLERRPDGYHEIDTLMLALDLCDVVDARLNPEPGIRLSLEGAQATPDIPTGESNLAARAARAVLEESGACAHGPGIEICLHKRIPSRAGLGGGSADAAAAALAARALLGQPLPDERLEELLAGLGSDCVFFLKAATTGFALCNGRGERVRPLPAPRGGWWIALLVPAIGSPTPGVYRALGFPLSPPRALPSLRLAIFDLEEEEARSLLYNRLESAALRTLEPLRAWRALLDERGAAHWRLSGSGSAFYGLYRERLRAELELAALAAAARARALELRGAWLARPVGHAARLA